MLDPVLEHVDNSFAPMPQSYLQEYSIILQRTETIMQSAFQMIQNADYKEYKELMEVADSLKDQLSNVRKMHIDRMQKEALIDFKTSQLYLNLLQETQELLSIMRHQLRASKKFLNK